MTVTALDVRREWETGLDYSEVAAKLGIRAEDAKDCLIAQGVPLEVRKPRAPALPDTDVLRAHRAAGMTLAEIGAKYGASGSSVSYRLRSA